LLNYFFRIFADEGYYNMKHNEEITGIATKEKSFIELENLKATLCGHLYKLSEFVKVESEDNL